MNPNSHVLLSLGKIAFFLPIIGLFAKYFGWIDFSRVGITYDAEFIFISFAICWMFSMASIALSAIIQNSNPPDK